MIAVIFEVWPKSDHEQDYFDAAQALKVSLEAVPGFISVERFRSVSDTGKILALSFFESEAALQTWRNTDEHRKTQALGRSDYFKDYRLRIATVQRDYGMVTREQAPADSRSVHEDEEANPCRSESDDCLPNTCTTAGNVIRYIASNFLTLATLAERCCCNADTIFTWISQECLPGPSYTVLTSHEVHSFFGARSTEPERLQYFPCSHIALVTRLQHLQTDLEPVGIHDLLQSEFIAAYSSSIKEQSAWRHGLFDARELPNLAEQEWRHWLNGTYGLCTKRSTAADIAIKEACVRELEHLVGDTVETSLNDQQLQRVSQAVAKLDNVSAEFAPDEYNDSSRRRWIDDVTDQLGLENPGQR
ncbi:MAG: antibiotic biosynthesis monooxygenase [Gammaproteobacteria bacterium]|nr:antibiotic biosynthesis monooxygenase [Gammaproteobacteria bacterium]